jgi:hypothetical protein
MSPLRTHSDRAPQTTCGVEPTEFVTRVGDHDVSIGQTMRADNPGKLPVILIGRRWQSHEGLGLDRSDGRRLTTRSGRFVAATRRRNKDQRRRRPEDHPALASIQSHGVSMNIH